MSYFFNLTCTFVKLSKRWCKVRKVCSITSIATGKAIYFACTQYWHIVDDFLSDRTISIPKESQLWKTAKLSCNTVSRTYLGTQICSLACHWPPHSVAHPVFDAAPVRTVLPNTLNYTNTTIMLRLHCNTFISTRNPQSTQSDRNGHLLTA